MTEPEVPASRRDLTTAASHQAPDQVRGFGQHAATSAEVPAPRRDLAEHAKPPSTQIPRRTALLSLFALSACGFTPALGPGGNAQGLRGRVAVAPPSDEEGFALVARLEERLGQADAADLDLTADLRVSEKALGFLPDGELSRFNVEGRANWRVTDATGRTVADGTERSFTSYSATSTTVATIFAQRDARRRLMVILADQIVSDLLARDL